MMGLFLDNKRIIAETCKFKVRTKEQLKPNYIMLDPDNHILINQGPLSIVSCPGQQDTEIPTPIFAILDIPCECTLRTTTLTLHVSRQNCNKQNTSVIEMNSGFNLPLALMFRLQTEKYSGETIEPAVFELILPTQHIMDITLSRISKNTLEEGIKIKSVAKSLSDNVQGVRDIWNKIHTNFRITTKSYIFTFVTFFLACLSLILTLYTLCRMHAVLAGLAMANLAKATPSLSIIRIKPADWMETQTVGSDPAPTYSE